MGKNTGTSARTQPVPVGAEDGASILALGVDVASVRCCLLENISGRYRLGGWMQTPRLPMAALDVQARELLQQMERRLHRPLWSADAMPLIASEETVSFPPLGQVAVAASPHGYVRTWLAGLTATQSIAAAREALAGGPAQVVGVTLHSADLQVGSLAASLAEAKADLVVIAGGYDFADSQAIQPLYELARTLAAVLGRTAPAQRPTVVFAGNRWAGAGVAEIIQSAGAGAVEIVDNVQPGPELLHAAALVQAVNFAYWRLCRRNEGMREISRWVTSPGHIGTLESSFAQLVRVWMELLDLPELHALYCSPAWWLHAAARQGRQGIALRYIEPQSRPPSLDAWPPLQLVSGEWPALWPRPALSWWDRSGLVPLVASIGQAAPQAMIETLAADLLEPQTR
jgi:hypothetical protein